VLPLGKGIVLDPFMGSGSTVAAAQALALSCIGIEKNAEYFEVAKESIPQLSRIVVPKDQLAFAAFA
jgi:site-specific DNA-methyltransferase (adenine-specific)